jgi:hypothetical protein
VLTRQFLTIFALICGLERRRKRSKYCGAQYIKRKSHCAQKKIRRKNFMTTSLPLWTQKGKTFEGQQTNDFAGINVAINTTGDVVAIGRRPDFEVMVYRYNDVEWKLIHQKIVLDELILPDTEIDPYLSINGDGNVIAIKRMFDGNQKSLTRVYRLQNNDLWTKRGKDIFGLPTGIGQPISINDDGTILIIGNPYTYPTDLVQPVVVDLVYRYNESGDEWFGEQINNVESGSIVSMNASGNVVAIGNMKIISEINTTITTTRVYEYKNSAWEQIGLDIIFNYNAQFGPGGFPISMNAEGNIVAIGSPPSYSPTAVNFVTVYKKNTASQWEQIGNPISGLGSGGTSSISINAPGDRIAIGYPFRCITIVYKFESEDWTQLGQIGAVNDLAYLSTGFSVSINGAGDVVVVGTPFVNAAKGRAVVYELGKPPPPDEDDEPPPVHSYSDVQRPLSARVRTLSILLMIVCIFAAAALLSLKFLKKKKSY